MQNDALRSPSLYHVGLTNGQIKNVSPWKIDTNNEFVPLHWESIENHYLVHSEYIIFMDTHMNSHWISPFITTSLNWLRMAMWSMEHLQFLCFSSMTWWRMETWYVDKPKSWLAVEKWTILTNFYRATTLEMPFIQNRKGGQGGNIK